MVRQNQLKNMEKLPRVFEERIAVASGRIIEPLMYPEKCPMQVKAMKVGGEPITYEEAMQRDFTPFKEGDAWAPSGIRSGFTLPVKFLPSGMGNPWLL